MMAYFYPLQAILSHVHMQHNFVHKRLIYANMHYDHADMQHNYVNMQGNYVDLNYDACRLIRPFARYTLRVDVTGGGGVPQW